MKMAQTDGAHLVGNPKRTAEQVSHNEMRLTKSIGVYASHEGSRQLIIEFVWWNPDIDKAYMMRTIKDTFRECFVSRENKKVAMCEWRHILAEAMRE